MLRENDLIELPKEIGELQRLRELHIQANRLTILPPEIGKFVNVTCIDMNSCLLHIWCGTKKGR